MQGTRRWFMRSAGQVAAGMAIMGGLGRAGARPASRRRDAFGPLVTDPAGRFDLPEGFGYQVFSTHGELMDDGFQVPALHDGMAAFPGGPGEVILVRNHEMASGPGGGAFGAQNEMLGRLPADRVYDAGGGTDPCLGGTTTLVWDLEEGRLKKHFLSLAGTHRNCSGGPTPWGSWISCEESTEPAGSVRERPHGYNFEVPASATEAVRPEPLVAMGRFFHEAIAVDPRSDAIYQTEDRLDGLFYRFLPAEPGRLAAGGQLQALRVRGAPSLDTRNWNDFTRFPVGEPVEVDWVDLDEVEAPEDDLRLRGFVRGAARFARGEGLWAGTDGIYFTATSGGPRALGQVWRYRPSPEEGQRGERGKRATLELFLEPNHRRLVDMCDNLTVSPWGDLLLCEDGQPGNNLVGVTPGGDIYPFLRNTMSDSELAGAVFSPDGSTLFVNVQWNGLSLAITGPWERAS